MSLKNCVANLEINGQGIRFYAREPVCYPRIRVVEINLRWDDIAKGIFKQRSFPDVREVVFGPANVLGSISKTILAFNRHLCGAGTMFRSAQQLAAFGSLVKGLAAGQRHLSRVREARTYLDSKAWRQDRRR
jgi:hypothetical protein